LRYVHTLTHLLQSDFQGKRVAPLTSDPAKPTP
jgi:hypothetical protein